MASKPNIVVGLDFGTTYSGIAWSLSNGAKDIEVLSTWPGGGNKTTPKAPTTVLYRDGDTLWGYQTGDFGDVIRGVKLLLDESQELIYKPARRSSLLLKAKDKTPTEVAGDYIMRMVALVEDTLARRFGVALSHMRLEYVLTVPAVWSDKAKDATLAAALKGGIARADVSLVSEPEAAALYSIESIQPNCLQDGDVILVCDAGGGTVDLISYCVESVSPLRLIEATQGTGDICGSTMLDEEFQKYLQKALGSQYENIPQRSLDLAMKYWEESVKPNFAGMVDDDEDDGYGDVDSFIPLPGVEDDAAPGIEDGFLVVSSDQIREIFEPVIQRVDALIQSQVDNVIASGKDTKAILLVGGFGASEYLFQRVKKKYGNIVVMQPPNAWSAVARGAALHGLEGNQVKQRISRRHYGINVCEHFSHGIKPEEGGYWCEFKEVWKRNDHMRWYLKKGDTINEQQPIKINLHWTIGVHELDSNPNQLRSEMPLYICHVDEAPKYLGKDISPLCSLRFNLTRIPRHLFERRTNSKGLEYYEIHFQILMKPTSASILFELLFDGEGYGGVNAEY